MGVIIIGGGPRPNAQIFAVTSPTSSSIPTRYAIMDGNELLAILPRLSHAEALLPLIQSGE